MQDLEDRLKAGAKEELMAHILPWWQKNMVDGQNGGFYGRIDGLGGLHPQAPKGAVLNARILWTFSSAALHLHLKNPTYLKVAQRAYHYFSDHFLDREAGGVFWMLDYKGHPVETRKQVYAQGFAIYALAEYYRVTGKEEVLQQAIGLFHLLEKHSFDPENGGYWEAHDRHWQPLDDWRLSEKDANEPKSMNTHLHILEGYTNLYRIWKSEKLAGKLVHLIEVFLQHIIHPETHQFQLFFGEKWEVKSSQISYGHDIEGSWLLYEAAEVLGDETLKEKVAKVSVSMAQKALTEGMDTDGGLFNERDGDHLDTDKQWWPQAEAVVGALNAWQLTGDSMFFERALMAWAFIQSKALNHEKGEWHFRVDKKGEPYKGEDLAGPWKCPYHNGRACLEMIQRL